MADTLGVTLSHADADRRRTGVAAPAPLLVLALECSRPGALSARWSLSGLAAVHLGRGAERVSERTTSELTIRVPDRWMSSRHARIENSFGRWVLVDTDSKNGTVVNGQATRRAVLADGDLIELGHTLFLFFERVAMYDDDPADVDLVDAGVSETPGLATLVPEYAREIGRLREVAASDISVLIEGESGTGKELLARAVHAVSGKTGAFVAVNCGALPANLVESELFGYKRGAFSGANADQPGLVRAADGGTLFLDEIGDLPPASQAALLRVLQEREVMPVGGTRPVAVNLRVVAATHRELDEMISGGQFRHDLFARLAGFRIEVPPLSERRADLGLLVGLLHQRLFVTPEQRSHPGFDVEAARMILRYPWPLNVRELEQALATAAVLAKATEVSPEHLPETVRTGRAPGAPRAAPLSESDQRQRDELVRVLREHLGNISAVARAMGKDRKQIQRWVKRFAIDPAEFRA